MSFTKIESRDVRSLLTDFMVTILRDDIVQWYEDGDQRHRCVHQGTSYTLDTNNGITKLSADDWFIQSHGAELHMWGDEDKFYRDVTMLRLFGIPSRF